MKTLLTGIKPTGTVHLGNYLGALKPALELSKSMDRTFLMVADHHALISSIDAGQLREQTTQMLKTLLVLTKSYPAITVFKQSDIPEILEISQILSTIAAKGLLNRSHAYKAAQELNIANKEHSDHGITLGLFTYPVLMASDILTFNSTHVPVGKDQIQHLEIARDLATAFNHKYGETFVVPNPVTNLEKTILGTDGRKMSKSYGNILPLIATEKEAKKAIAQIVTDCKTVEEAKDPEACIFYQIYKELAQPQEAEEMADKLKVGGYGYGTAKKALLEVYMRELGHLKAEVECQDTATQIQELRQIAQEQCRRAKVACGLAK